jgi:hypothetical protein
VEIHRRSQASVEDSITVEVVRDITEREEAHLRLYQMAHQDALTGLPNRSMFFESLAKALSQAKQNNWGVAVDHFKTVNDTHGGGSREPRISAPDATVRSRSGMSALDSVHLGSGFVREASYHRHRVRRVQPSPPSRIPCETWPQRAHQAAGTRASDG